MTGIYGNSKEDKIRERELDKHTEKDDYTYDDDVRTELEKAEYLAEQPNYKFPESLNNNINFRNLIRLMQDNDLSEFLNYISIIADEKEDRDTRNWASDQLNVFLNKIVKELGKK